MDSVSKVTNPLIIANMKMMALSRLHQILWEKLQVFLKRASPHLSTLVKLLVDFLFFNINQYNDFMRSSDKQTIKLEEEKNQLQKESFN